MRIALIKDNIVTNIILGDQAYADQLTGMFVIVDGMDCNIGDFWNGVSFSPPAPPIAPPAVWEWYIDIGPFFDRLGAQKLAVLSSVDSTVQAILRDVQVRKWVDLKRPDVAQSLAYIGTKVAGVNGALQTAILDTPVTDTENMALRKTYFS